MLKRLILKKEEHEERYPADITCIVDALELNGYEATRQEAALLWSKHSEDYCAGWLCLPTEGSEIFTAIKPYIED